MQACIDAPFLKFSRMYRLHLQLVMKVAPTSDGRESTKLRREVRHLAAARSLASHAGAHSVVVPAVRNVIDTPEYFGFIAEWLDGPRFADLFRESWRAEASPNAMSRYFNNLLLDLRRVWSLGVGDDSAAARGFAEEMYVERPLKAFRYATSVRGGMWHAEIAEGPVVINVMERRNPLEILTSLPDWLLSSARLRPCISGDLTVNNLKAMPNWKVGV